MKILNENDIQDLANHSNMPNYNGAVMKSIYNSGGVEELWKTLEKPMRIKLAKMLLEKAKNDFS